MQQSNIPGIYNYCDRWCERCSFTSRCLLYAQEQELTEERPFPWFNGTPAWCPLKLSVR
ncbi:MAG: hypothetical protein KDD19_25495 [Phaeodactylibacter sp.]|nr:hypothetical protein [Phaeodactylibacter sp.]MCB9048222.1 hypothetical protein [Lewinellaceae bacterium]